MRGGTSFILRQNAADCSAYAFNCLRKKIAERNVYIVNAPIAGDAQGESESVPAHAASAAVALRSLKVDQNAHLEIFQSMTLCERKESRQKISLTRGRHPFRRNYLRLSRMIALPAI